MSSPECIPRGKAVNEEPLVREGKVRVEMRNGNGPYHTFRSTRPPHARVLAASNAVVPVSHPFKTGL